MLELIKVIILGIVEGITEWLPISSTGHMILVDEFIKLNMSEAFKEMFFVVIQLGAIMAVVVLYWNKLFPFSSKSGASDENNVKRLWLQALMASFGLFMLSLFFGSMFKLSGALNLLLAILLVILVLVYACYKKPMMYRYDWHIDKDIINMWLKIVVASIPAAIVGIALDDYLGDLMNWKVVSIMLILFGILFIVVEKWNENRQPVVNSIADITYQTALIIGVWQVVAAIFPGTSRSGATIVGALVIGVSRFVAAEFTFFMAVPVMFGASFLKLLKFGLAFSFQELSLLFAGMLVAFIVSILTIRFLMSYIKKNDFKAFGWYRIALGTIVILYFVLK